MTTLVGVSVPGFPGSGYKGHRIGQPSLGERINPALKMMDAAGLFFYSSRTPDATIFRLTTKQEFENVGVVIPGCAAAPSQVAILNLLTGEAAILTFPELFSTKRVRAVGYRALTKTKDARSNRIREDNLRLEAQRLLTPGDGAHLDIVPLLLGGKTRVTERLRRFVGELELPLAKGRASIRVLGEIKELEAGLPELRVCAALFKTWFVGGEITDLITTLVSSRSENFAPLRFRVAPPADDEDDSVFRAPDAAATSPQRTSPKVDLPRGSTTADLSRSSPKADQNSDVSLSSEEKKASGNRSDITSTISRLSSRGRAREKTFAADRSVGGTSDRSYGRSAAAVRGKPERPREPEPDGKQRALPNEAQPLETAKAAAAREALRLAMDVAARAAADPETSARLADFCGDARNASARATTAKVAEWVSGVVETLLSAEMPVIDLSPLLTWADLNVAPVHRSCVVSTRPDSHLHVVGDVAVDYSGFALNFLSPAELEALDDELSQSTRPEDQKLRVMVARKLAT